MLQMAKSMRLYGYTQDTVGTPCVWDAITCNSDNSGSFRINITAPLQGAPCMLTALQVAHAGVTVGSILSLLCPSTATHWAAQAAIAHVQRQLAHLARQRAALCSCKCRPHALCTASVLMPGCLRHADTSCVAGTIDASWAALGRVGLAQLNLPKQNISGSARQPCYVPCTCHANKCLAQLNLPKQNISGNARQLCYVLGTCHADKRLRDTHSPHLGWLAMVAATKQQD